MCSSDLRKARWGWFAIDQDEYVACTESTKSWVASLHVDAGQTLEYIGHADVPVLVEFFTAVHRFGHRLASALFSVTEFRGFDFDALGGGVGSRSGRHLREGRGCEQDQDGD